MTDELLDGKRKIEDGIPLRGSSIKVTASKDGFLLTPSEQLVGRQSGILPIGHRP